MAYFPMFVDLKGKTCLVIGGGVVAYRKIKTLLQYEAQMIVIAPSLSPKLKELQERNKEQIRWITKEITSMEEVRQQWSVGSKNGCRSDREEVALVLCATNNRKINEEIALWCHSKKIPVNVVDQQELCTFFFPAIVKKKEVSIGITTSGVSPGMSSYLREQIEELVDDQVLDFLEEIGDYRLLLKETVKSEEERREKLRQKIGEWKRERENLPFHKRENL